MFSDRTKLKAKTKIWSIDSAQITSGRLNPVNDNPETTHWAITLVEPTQVDVLLDSINNADGWTKVRSFWFLLPIEPANSWNLTGSLFCLL